jgi:hypothetical protein
MRRKILILWAGCLVAATAGVPQATDEGVWDPDWPREFIGENGGKLVMYQPQVTAWRNYETLEGRTAVAFSVTEDAAPSLGAIEMVADTETDLESRLVKVSGIRFTRASFPSANAEATERLVAPLEELYGGKELIVSLDRILANLERSQRDLEPVAARPDPPKIFTSTEPAILVLLDGPLVLSPIEKSDLEFVINTNWDLFVDPATTTFYLRNDDVWLKARQLAGTWSPAGKLPKSFKKLSKKDENWNEVRASLPGRKIEPEEVPAVFYSQEPAELLLIEGEPRLALIEGTQLLWVVNTESDLFLSSADSHFYYLVSGRWFRAASLDGPWEFATPDLPADFARIEPDHPRGRVLASVPETPEAQEAVILAQIPQKATVERDQIEAPQVYYQGDPEFQPIEGTTLQRAANTPYDVVRVGDLYYLCFQAVWFVSASPTGPWEVADTIPDEIYDIPPSSPVYHTTYVEVYDSTPVHVTFGYTSGYWGVYYSSGCMVYGTGWYWPPYVYWGPYYPIYYPYPVSYGVSAWYNPNTGTYGRGASVYGPYGGMGRAAAYNPTTGTYGRGAAAWGPYQARGWAEAYNPSTGTYARTRQGGNVYSSWGTTGIQRGDDWVRTAHYSDSRGTIAGYKTSEGTRGFVGRDENNLYAGRDGNVYRRDEEGWQKYDNGDWNEVQRPEGGDAGQLQERAKNRTGEGSPDRDRIQQQAGERSLDRGQLQGGTREGSLDRGRIEDRATQQPADTGRLQGGSGAGTAGDATGGGQTRQRPDSLGGSRGGSSGGRVDPGTMDQLSRDYRGRSQGHQRSEAYRSWRGSGGGSGSYGGRGSYGSRGGARRRR